LHLIGEKEWSKIITSAVDFATHVCLSYENYISEEFATRLKAGT
jgi:fructokinase